jgi:hypothetical protein
LIDYEGPFATGKAKYRAYNGASAIRLTLQISGEFTGIIKQFNSASRALNRGNVHDLQSGRPSALRPEA